MSDLHDRIVKIALGQVGVRESGGPNRGLPLERYGLHGEDPLPWCARFVRWVVSQAGRDLPLNQWMAASVARTEEAMGMMGWLHRDPQPGDIVFFSSRSGSDRGPGRHCGIVVRVDADRIATVEGNRSDCVATAIYPRAYKGVTSFGRLPS